MRSTQVRPKTPPALFQRNVDTIIDKSSLTAKIASGKKLRVKHGLDPTGKDIHIGRAVVLWKLREFQELGHKIVIIIGDYTAQIGDPSDKLEKRPFLAEKQIRENLKNYLPQIGKILDLEKTEVRRNSEWLSKLTFRDVSELADLFTIQQITERENFKVRLQKNEPVGLRETLYPLMQGYDSVAVKADLELGGTDQLFNLLAGRKIQEFYGQKSQDVMTTKMLIGTDGRKMSTSWGNVINIADRPNEMYGKVMAVRDELISEYFHLATDKPELEIQKLESELKAGGNPKEIKEILAAAVVGRYYGAAEAKKAGAEFDKVFSKKEMPTEMPTLSLRGAPGRSLTLTDLLLQAGVPSKSEARRLITQKAVKLNSKVLKDPAAIINIEADDILQIGKRRFFRLEAHS